MRQDVTDFTGIHKRGLVPTCLGPLVHGIHDFVGIESPSEFGGYGCTKRYRRESDGREFLAPLSERMLKGRFTGTVGAEVAPW